MTRKPVAFTPDEVASDMTPPSAAPIVDASLPEVAPAPLARPRRAGWAARMFWSGLATVATLAAGLAVERMIADAFAATAVVGWVMLAGAVAMVSGLAIVVGRELLALRRLARVEDIRLEAEAALAAVSDTRAAAVASSLRPLLGANPRAARGCGAYDAAVEGEIIDGRDRLRILEREVLEPLDREATRLIAAAARRVSIVTAVSPRALVDMAVVLYSAVRLVRDIGELYGVRPGTLARWRLFRQVLGHLALTGGMAAGDEIVQQLVGHGLAARLSAKLGEGVLNGLTTARLGLAAVDLIRPLPFIKAPRPDLRDFAGDLFGSTPKA